MQLRAYPLPVVLVVPLPEALLSQVILVMNLILVMPAMNASSERSFSAIQSVKSYLRSTLTQERLNHLMHDTTRT